MESSSSAVAVDENWWTSCLTEEDYFTELAVKFEYPIGGGCEGAWWRSSRRTGDAVSPALGGYV
tara:strand:- start:226 stop:417 length:192 start_codon:yes stop_codon:yes gene_type:complete